MHVSLRLLPIFPLSKIEVGIEHPVEGRVENGGKQERAQRQCLAQRCSSLEHLGSNPDFVVSHVALCNVLSLGKRGFFICKMELKRETNL